VRSQIIPEIADVVEDEAPDLHQALVFGSVARNEADEQSDVDLLLVWPDETSDAVRANTGAAISRRVTNLLGNECRPLHYSITEFDNLKEVAPDLARAVEGDSIELLVVT
jgi:predicted nucleotidyltransferase